MTPIYDVAVGGRHPIFAAFPPYKGILRRGFGPDYIGTMTRPEYVGSWAAEHDVDMTAEYPPVNEELFEWIELLESVRAARSSYTYVELGAGYGRWAARAALAARRRGITRFRAVLVEAEPQHAAWARQHLHDNGLMPDQYVVLETAVAAEAGQATFAVEMAQGSLKSPARDWYGQALMAYTSNDRASGRTYHGRPVFDRDDGFHSIHVQSVTLDNVLADLEYVDFVDMDIQSAEADVIESSLSVLDAKVAWLTVGTHAVDLHERIRAALEGLGWHKRWDFRPGNTVDTVFGPISFSDGVLSWANPRFVDISTLDRADSVSAVPALTSNSPSVYTHSSHRGAMDDIDSERGALRQQLAAPPPLDGRQNRARVAELPDAVDRVRRSIVQIRCGTEPRGTGTLVHEDGFVIAAWHTIAGVASNQLKVGFAGEVTETTRFSFNFYPLTIVDVDEAQDLALLRLDQDRPLRDVRVVVQYADPATLTPQVATFLQERPRDGTSIAVSGYPLPTAVLVTNAGWLATAWGTKSKQLRDGVTASPIEPELADAYLADMRANAGNSGGPVYRIEDGAVLGICVVGRTVAPAPFGPTMIVPARAVAGMLARHGRGNSSGST